MRLLIAVLVVVAGALVGYVAWLNGAPITLRLGPGRTLEMPLAAALLAAFAIGAALVGLMALVGALRRAWHRMRERRRARKVAKREAQTARARELAWTGASEQARATILRSERGDPTERDRAELVAQTYVAEGNLSGANELLIGALERHPGDVRLLDLLATVTERRDDPERAIELIDRARREDPDSPRLAGRLRDLYVRTGRWREALALQDEIVARLKSPEALAREEETSLGLRFEVARAGDDPERSAKQLATLGREHPDFVPAWVEAGERFLAAGKPAKARKVWERGAFQRPAGPLLERLEALDASEGASERTTKRYRALLQRHGDDPALRRRFVRHLLAVGDTDAASAELEQLDRSSPPTAFLAGEMLRQRGEHERAAATVCRALGPELGITGAQRCSACGVGAEAWAPRCTACGRWGTLAGDAG
jgi:HemY protein